MPKRDRFSRAVEATDHIANKYFDLFSSPTRGEFKYVASTTLEAILLFDHIQGRNNLDKAREERLSNKMRRRVYKVPKDGNIRSISKAELRELAT